MRDQRPRAGEGPRLLILEDEEMIGQMVRRMAEASGFEARYVSDPEVFLEKAAAWVPAVIMVDLVMPRMDGVQVIRALADQGCDSSLIITSGVGERLLDAARRSARAHGLGIAGVLQKPFTARVLCRLLQDALNARGNVAPGHALPAKPATSARITVSDLEAGLERGELSVAYQPKVHCRTRALVGFEALARWRHPRLGPVSPDDFIPLAEASGLIERLTENVAGQALKWLAGLPGYPEGFAGEPRALTGSTLSLNVSAVSLGNEVLSRGVVERCREVGVSPERVILELTESSATQDVTEALDGLTRLRLQGFHLSIDDFGTGYSSMVQLVRLPFSEIKIDKRFVINTRGSEESRAIIRSVVDLGRSLGLHTTAEGVEDEWTLDFLAGLGCDFAQGFGISPPLPPEAVIPWFRRREHEREERRLVAVEALGWGDSTSASRYRRIVALAARLCEVPMAALTVMGRDQQWFCAGYGLELARFAPKEALALATIGGDGVFTVADASRDRRFRDSPLVTAPPRVRFFAGCPLYLSDGHKVGLLSLMDDHPMRSPADGLARLPALARFAEAELARGVSAVEANSPSGLDTREPFQCRARDALALCRELDLDAVLISLRVLDLGMVNQRFGRCEGDSLIDIAARIIGEQVGDADLLGRRRGTEVAALAIDPVHGAVEGWCERLTASVEQWNAQQGQGAARLCCEVASSLLEPATTGRLDDTVRGSWTTYATVGA